MSEFAATTQRETYPLVTSDDTLVMVFRDHITANSLPVLFVKGLRDSRVRVDSSQNLDPRTGIRVVNFANGGTDTITVTVDGVATIFTEASEFTAAVSNNETAIRISVFGSSAVGETE